MPRLAFVNTQTALAFVDTDMFDQQKYVEEVGGDSESIRTKRASHEAELMKEFMDGFNQSKECDGIILMGEGDQKPDFALQIIIDSHDTPKQKTVWNWVVRDMANDRVLPVGFNIASGKDAAIGICQAVWKEADPQRFKKVI